ncbi:patatin-like phospholipase family protein [Caminibacter mediatlanticus]|uniref:PNPLA domain-containing protein n=1 Tax=Caminibacter mediatlanticus TB-2 TaxID=391592 RepID=A0AAI9AGT7_9BACT|nr:patatin-like phospholipase family protein [Caminibacter mediatlanticus]EDM23408.1 hypothetical protein CMTB2_09090 [Caminibacter mediatlanticus TB-2]
MKLSIALSGGAARGVFHLGFLDVLLKEGVEIKEISGSSAGAIVAGAIACKIPLKDIFEIVKSKEFKSIFKFSLKTGLFKIDLNSTILDKFFLYDDLSKSDIPLFICVTDFQEEKALYLNAGDPKKIIPASCAIYPFFEPIVYKDKILVDGGYKDNLPSSPLNGNILGINVVPNCKIEKLTHKNIIIKISQMLIRNTINYEKIKYLIEPQEICKIRAFSFNDLDECYGLGKKYAFNWLRQL